jgi:hypothetical protein
LVAALVLDDVDVAFPAGHVQPLAGRVVEEIVSIADDVE